MPLASITSISSACIRGMGPHQLNDPATILVRLHLPYDLLQLLGVQTEMLLHLQLQHKELINNKRVTSASVIGFWQLRSKICCAERTACGNMLMPPSLDDDDSSLRSSSSLASRSLIWLRFVPLHRPPPPLPSELVTAISSFTGLFPVVATERVHQHLAVILCM